MMSNVNNSKMFLLLVTLCSGIIGGVISSKIGVNSAIANTIANQAVASSFVLTDKTGNVRAGLVFDINGHPVLVFKDERGNNSCYFGLGNQGPIFYMENSSGSTKTIIRTTNENGASIIVSDKNNSPQMMVQSTIEGRRSLSMYDKNGKCRLAIALVDEIPGFALLDSTQRMQVSMQARGGKGALISLHDHSDAPSLAMGLRDGKSFMYAFDKDGSGVFGGGQPGKGPALVLKERGKITWAAGSSGVASDARELERSIDLDALTKDWLR